VIDFYGSKRLAESTLAGQSSVVSKHWIPWCKANNISPIILTGDENRGGIIASFFVDLLLTLRYKTVVNYVWHVREWMKGKDQGRQMDPLEGVHDWEDWLNGVEVESWELGDSHEEVPFEAIIGTVNIADSKCYDDVLTVVLILTIWFTCCRSEFPLPKTPGAFDIKKHCRLRDVKAGPNGTAWAMGTIKQDRKGQRDGMAVAPGDTVPRKESLVGRVAGVMDLYAWVLIYMEMRPGTDENAPFFVRQNGDTACYDFVLKYWRSMMQRASIERGPHFAFHGLRVGAYNAGRMTKDPSMIVAIGDWGSESGHARYGRRRKFEVMDQAQQMVCVADQFREQVFATSSELVSISGYHMDTGLPPMPLAAALASAPKANVQTTLVVADPAKKVRAVAVRPIDKGSRKRVINTDVNVVLDHTPPGFERVQKTTGKGRSYFVYYSNDGKRFESSKTAWCYYNELDLNALVHVPSSSGPGSSSAHATIATDEIVPVAHAPESVLRVSRTSQKAVFKPGPNTNRLLLRQLAIDITE